MKKKLIIKISIVISFIIMLTGCSSVGTAAERVAITNSRTYNASYDKTWSAIINIIGKNNLTISTLEKDSGIISVSDTIYNPSWANEGTRGSSAGVSDIVTDRRARFNIVAKKVEDKTLVQVNSNFSMNIRSGNGSQMFPFSYHSESSYSNGTFEKIILDDIEEQVK